MAHAHDRTLLASLAFADPDKKSPLHDLACQYIARPEVTASFGWTSEQSYLASPFEGWTKHPQNSLFWFREQEVVSEEELRLQLGSVQKRVFPVQIGNTSFDWMLTKGQGQYATTIGFIDVVFLRHVVLPSVEIKHKKDSFVVFKTEDEAKQYCGRVKKLTGYYDVNYQSVEEVRAEDIVKPTTFHAQYRIQQEKLIAPSPAGWRTEHYEIRLQDVEKSIDPFFVEVKIGEVGLGDVLRQINLYRGYLSLQGYGSAPWLVAAAFEMSSSFVEGLRSQNIEVVHLGENFRKWAAEQKTVKPSVAVQSI